jgi:hypothetical protein
MQERPGAPKEAANAELARTWRPQLWVRLVAVLVAALVGLALLFPQMLNPSWAEGTPASELPWALALFGIALAAAVSTSVSKVEVTEDRVRVVNPWRASSIPRSEVVDVRPGALGVEFVTAQGRALSALAVQCTRVGLGGRPRWIALAEAVTGRPDAPPGGQALQQAGNPEGLAQIVAAYGRDRRYPVMREEREDRLEFRIHVPAKGVVELTLDGEVFTLTFPGGYRWGDFAQDSDEAQEVLRQLLTFIDSYGDRATVEVDAPRKLRPARRELRLSNGVVLRAKGWSKGPPPEGN